MKKLGFIRSVSKWGYWICAIGRVFAAIAAVCLLLAVVFLISMPRNFVSMEILTEMKIDVNLRDFLGEDWDAYKNELADTISPDGALTENGISIAEPGETVTMENRALALYIIPSFAEYSMLFALLHFASKAFRELKDSPVPFTPSAAKHIRTAGSLTMALGLVPGLASGLIGLLTDSAMDGTSIDLGLVFIGFLLWALAELFEYGVSLQCGAAPTDPGQSGYDPNAF